MLYKNIVDVLGMFYNVFIISFIQFTPKFKDPVIIGR